MTLSDSPVRTRDATGVTREGQPVLIALSYHRQLKGSVCSRIARASGTVDSTSLVSGERPYRPTRTDHPLHPWPGRLIRRLGSPSCVRRPPPLDSGSCAGMTAGASVWRSRSGDPGVQESNPRRDIRLSPQCPHPPTMAVWGLSKGPETSAPPAGLRPLPRGEMAPNVTKCHPLEGLSRARRS